MKIKSIAKTSFKFILDQTSVRRIKRSYPDIPHDEVEMRIAHLNVSRLIPLSATLGLVYAIFVCIDINTGYYETLGHLKCLSIIAGFALSFCSLSAFVGACFMLLRRRKDKRGMIWLYRFFYFMLSGSMALFNYVDVMRGFFPHSLYYLAMILAALPVFLLHEQIFFLLLNAVASLAIFVVAGQISGWMVRYITIVVGTLVLSVYLRANTFRMFYQQISLQKLSRKYENLSKIDSLTGLPNRRSLNDYVDHRLPFWRKYCIDVLVLMVDIDDFKSYNDTFSHLDGDDCLTAVAATLTTILKKSGKFGKVARVGGEEFIMIVELTQGETALAKQIAESIRKAVEDLKIIAGTASHYPYITVSVGGYIYSPAVDEATDGCNISAAFRLADYELYKAKKGGRNVAYISGQAIGSAEETGCN